MDNAVGPLVCSRLRHRRRRPECVMSCGDGRHQLPIAAAIRETFGKANGDDVVSHLDQRFS